MTDRISDRELEVLLNWATPDDRLQVGSWRRLVHSALTELQTCRAGEAQAAPAETAVYVLVSQSDCVCVEGVYATLDAAKQAADLDAEQPPAWQQHNRGEASHLIPPFDQWFADAVDDGELVSYTIWLATVRGAVSALTPAELRALYEIAFGHDPTDRWDEATEALRAKLRGLVVE